jgi:thiol-disulfide isomerase/thioredoxin
MTMLLLSPIVTPAANEAPPNVLDFNGGIDWINSKPLTLQDLRGKVVLVDFWEYTCINCLRTLPYLRTWEKRYADDGLVIVGVHTNEFGFSGKPQNVAAAVKRLDITWPVVVDTNDVIWNRYHNNFWPHELLYGRDGKLVESVEGEGGYPQTEAKIQSLLKAANPSLQLPPVMQLLPQDSYDKPGARCYPETAETFVGGRHGRIANAPGGLASRSPQTQYVDSGTSHPDGQIYLQGYWRGTQQAMVTAGNDGRLTMTYHAVQVVSVMQPEQGPVTVIVMQDGKPVPQEDAGSDIRYNAQGQSYVDVDAGRAYDLIMNKRWGTHELQLFPQRYGLGIYSFAFESCEASPA